MKYTLTNNEVYNPTMAIAKAESEAAVIAKPQIPPPVEVTIDSGVPIPKELVSRSDLNARFGKLPFHLMNEGQSFALDNLSEREFVALRARVSRANKNYEGRFALKQEDKTDYGIRARVYKVE